MAFAFCECGRREWEPAETISIRNWALLRFREEVSFFKKLIFLRKRKGERQTSVCCSAYVCIHWSLLACALTRVESTALVCGDHSGTNQLPGWGFKWLLNRLNYSDRER